MNAYDETLETYLPPEDGSEGLGSFPAGNYICRILDVEPKQTQKGGFMWRLPMEIADGGPYSGRKLWYNMNWLDEQGQISGGIGFTQAALKALGLPHMSNNGQVVTNQVRKSDIVGKFVVAIVSIQQGGQYAGRNQVDRLEAVPNQPQAAPQQQYQPTPPPQQAYAPQQAPWQGQPQQPAPYNTPAPMPAQPAWQPGQPPANMPGRTMDF